ncbi:MAG: WbuC family cupin fold metalloprotein [Balneolales bacterium]
MVAFPNITGPVFHLDGGTMASGLEASRKSSRLRIILPLHRSQDAQVQRMVNFLQPGTYIRPHQHPRDHAIESIVLVQGSLSFFIFDDEGRVTSHLPLNESGQGALIDIEPRIWHSFIVTQPDTVIFEVKRGPYDPETDKLFARWAPVEGGSGTGEYLRFLGRHVQRWPS